MPRQPNPSRPLWAAAIAEARVKAGLTQEELGKLINRPVTTIKKYETGARVPPFDVVYEIAEATGADAYEMVSMDLRHGGSTGVSQFVDPSFRKALRYINNNNIEVEEMFDMGYTDDDVEFLDTKTCKSVIYSKTEFLLEVAKIKNELKKKYEVELRKRVTEHLNSIFDSGGFYKSK